MSLTRAGLRRMGVCASEASDLCLFFKAMFRTLFLEGLVRVVRFTHPDHERVRIWTGEAGRARHGRAKHAIFFRRDEWDAFVGIFVQKHSRGASVTV